MCGLHYIILLQSLSGEGAQWKRDIMEINLQKLKCLFKNSSITGLTAKEIKNYVRGIAEEIIQDDPKDFADISVMLTILSLDLAI